MKTDHRDGLLWQHHNSNLLDTIQDTLCDSAILGLRMPDCGQMQSQFDSFYMQNQQ